jgi:hypothetical protein
LGWVGSGSGHTVDGPQARARAEIQYALWIVTDGRVDEVAVTRFEVHSMLHVIAALLDTVIGKRVSSMAVVVILI